MVRNAADLDPLEASATPISPDPSLRSSRNKRHRELVASGMSEEEAAAAMIAEDRARFKANRPSGPSDDIREAVRRGQLYPQEAALLGREREIEDDAASLGMEPSRSTPPMWERAAADQDRAGNYMFRHSPAGLVAVPSLRNSRPSQPAPVSRDELIDAGLLAETELGPATADGLPRARGVPFRTAAEARQYVTRRPLSPEEQAAAREAGIIDATFAPSQRDKDREAAGEGAFWNEDGTVSYRTLAPSPTENFLPRDQSPMDFQRPFVPAQREATPAIPGAIGRPGRREDLEAPLSVNGVARRDQNGRLQPRFVAHPMPGPNGTRYAYVPSDATRQYNQELREEQRLARQATAAGVDEDALAAMSPAERRRAVRDARRSRDAQAMDNVRAVGMLTGGQPSWGPGGTGTTAMQLLQEPQEWRNLILAQNLAPRIDGTTPLTVQAHNAEEAIRLLRAAQLSDGGNSELNDVRERAGNAAAAEAESKLSTPAQADIERERNGGKLPAASPAGVAVLKDIEEKYIGPVAMPHEVNAAVEAAVAEGIARDEAERFFDRRRANVVDWAFGPGTIDSIFGPPKPSPAKPATGGGQVPR